MEQNNEFIHTGIKHTRVEVGHVQETGLASSTRGHTPVVGPNSSTNEIKYVLDQHDYASATKPVSRPG